jgi:hypothetical protein
MEENDKVKEFIPKILYVVPNVLTKEECKEWIEKSEKEIGYLRPNYFFYADTDTEKKYPLRKNQRTEKTECIELSTLIQQRLQKFLDENGLMEAEGGREFSEVYERVRFLKYEKEDHFKTHIDESNFRNEGTKKGHYSEYSLIIYLNGKNFLFYKILSFLQNVYTITSKKKAIIFSK